MIGLIIGVLAMLYILAVGRQWNAVNPRDDYQCGTAVGFLAGAVLTLMPVLFPF